MPTKSLTMTYHQEQILAIYLEEELLLQQKKEIAAPSPTVRSAP